jgi:hypothetical protein
MKRLFGLLASFLGGEGRPRSAGRPTVGSVAAGLALLGLGSLLLAAPAARAAQPVPAWSIQSITAPTNFEPGDESGKDGYLVFFTNSGGAPTEEVEGTGEHVPITIVDTVPAGLTVEKVELLPSRNSGANIANNGVPPACETEPKPSGTRVECKVTDALLPAFEPANLRPGEQLLLRVFVKTPASTTGTLVNRAEVEGGGAAPASAEFTNQASATPAAPGFEYFTTELTGPDGLPVSAADSHPYDYVTSFATNTVATEPGSPSPFVVAGGDLKEIEVALPPGLMGNPMAIERCSARQFMTIHGAVHSGGTAQTPNECPAGAAVGLAAVQQLEGEGGGAMYPLYNLDPPKGMPAQLGFQVSGLPIYINTRLRSDSDYGLTAYLANTTEAQRVTASRITIWGTPWDPSHDPLRAQCAELEGSCPVEGTPRPFMRLPSSCADPLVSAFHFETWAQPPAAATASFTEGAPTGCGVPPFGPTIEAKPTTDRADSPTGLHFDLHLPQAENEDPEGLGEADLRDARVTLPDGLVVNPASADGLGACTPAQVGLTTAPGATPAHFDLAPVTCPDASKLGTVEAVAPAVDHPLKGAAYLATQEDNPFDSLIAFYIVLEDPQTGIVVKLPARVDLDPATGRVTTTVAESPQVPVEDFTFDFFDGPRAPLRTPQTCGTHTTTTRLTPWTAPAGADATPSASFRTSAPAAGQGSCPTDEAGVPASWSFTAGSGSPVAGAYTPFTVHLARPDGTQELSSLEVTLPAGVAARFAGVPECTDAQIAAAKAREVSGGGRAEQQSPSCPATSRIGTATVGAGAGSGPYYVTGDAYLAGPYKGAPFSIVVITPAVAGPFDLGAVVVRSALYVDPFTAQGTVRSDPIPRILDGIPLDVRSLTVDVDRPGFTLNPTSCEAKAVAGTAVSTGGAHTALTNRFQVGECAALKFKPKLKLSLKGSTRHAGHPALRAVLTYPRKGAYANIARAQVNLPHSEFIDQGNLDKTCTRPVLLEGNCTKRSIYGYARAWTPLLEKPLQGPVYLVGGFGYKLPALVAELGGRLRVLLVGKVDSGRNHGIRNTFEAVPDAPVERFELRMKGGKKYSLLENSEDLCRRPQRAIARFTAQNGRVLQWKPKIANSCGKKGKKKHHKARKGHRPGR